MVAWSEMLAGAALLASDTSASWGIAYSLKGGYFVSWASIAIALRTHSNATELNLNLLIFIPSFLAWGRSSVAFNFSPRKLSTQLIRIPGDFRYAAMAAIKEERGK